MQPLHMIIGVRVAVGGVKAVRGFTPFFKIFTIQQPRTKTKSKGANSNIIIFLILVQTTKSRQLQQA